MAYESLMLFQLSIFWPACASNPVPPQQHTSEAGLGMEAQGSDLTNPLHPECTDLFLGFSR